MPAGNIADLAFAIQAAKGTPSTASSQRIYLTGGGIAPVKTTARLTETSGTRMQSGSYVSQVRAEGTPAAYVRPKMIGALLYAAMGAKAVTGASDPYEHTFTFAATQPWMTFWRKLATLYERFADCKLTSLQIRSSAGQPLTVTFNVLGLAPAFRTAAEATVTVEKTDTFMHFDGKGALKVENTAVTRIESIDLNIQLGTVSQQGDDVVPYDVTEGGVVVTLETTETILDFGLRNRMLYGTATPADNAAVSTEVLELGGSPAGIDFKFTRVPAAPGPERSLQFLAERVQIEEITGVELNTDGTPIKQTVRYGLYEPLAGGSGLTAKLKNGQASYTAS